MGSMKIWDGSAWQIVSQQGPLPPSVPPGGTVGQMLAKNTATNYDTVWSDVPKELPTGGAAGQVLAKNSATNYDVGWSTETWQNFTPTMRTNTGTVALGNSTFLGRYVRVGNRCTVRISFTAGSTWNGSVSHFWFGLPLVASASAYQELGLVAHIYSHAYNFAGFATIPPGTGECVPYLPLLVDRSLMYPVQNADSSAQPGTGVPNISGVYPFAAGSVIRIFGTYECA
jgi:hypothetical protein